MEDEDEKPTIAQVIRPGDSAEELTATITTVDVDDNLPPGTDVGGYIVDGALGRGGMGVVYSATHPVIGKRAAIKVLKPELSRDQSAVERFALEARAVNQIGHPNIVDIFAFGALPDGRSYYVMDLLAGESLRARIKRGPMHVSEAAHIIDETASALIAAHAKGIVHRDLKPDNVFVVEKPGGSPEIRVLDWGLAKLAPNAALAGTAKARTLAGSIIGTPVYMSPEQARASSALDHRTDIYALGVMSYELLSGEVPFRGRSSLDTLLAHQDDPVPPLLARVPTLPVELAQLIEAMLAKEPADRPTLAAVRAVLKRLKGTQIPTMTAAGLALSNPHLQPAFDPDDSGLGVKTVKLRATQEVTQQRAPTPPVAPERASQSQVPAPGTFMTTQPGYSVPPPAALSPIAQGSIPPPSAPNVHVHAHGHHHAHPHQHVPPRAQTPYPVPNQAIAPAARHDGLTARSWLVIAIAAVIASTIGIVIALVTK